MFRAALQVSPGIASTTAMRPPETPRSRSSPLVVNASSDPSGAQSGCVPKVFRARVMVLIGAPLVPLRRVITPRAADTMRDSSGAKVDQNIGMSRLLYRVISLGGGDVDETS